jgi:hypothetical protein
MWVHTNMWCNVIIKVYNCYELITRAMLGDEYFFHLTLSVHVYSKNIISINMS